MNFFKTQLNWFDCLVLGLIVFGVWRGRKRGLSEELLEVFQWLCIVVISAMAYPSVGQLFTSGIGTSAFWSNVLAYILIAMIIKMCFTMVKRATGEKLVQSDAFGMFEYYLGMVAGVVRLFCILIFLLSFLHAKHISAREMAETARMQADNFGSISFPTLGSLQQSIFKQSLSGRFIQKNLQAQLLQPAGGSTFNLESSVRRSERTVEEVLK